MWLCLPDFSAQPCRSASAVTSSGGAQVAQAQIRSPGTAYPLSSIFMGKVRWKKGTTEASKIAHVISIGPHPKKVTNLSREDNQKIGRNFNETWTAWSFFFGKTQVYLYRSGITHRLGSIVSDSVRLFKDTACAQQCLYCIYFGEAERLHSDGKEVAERNCSAASL